MTLRNAFENLAVESKQDTVITALGDLLTELQTQQKDGLTDTELRAADVEVNDDAAQALLQAIVDSLGPHTTVNTVRELLLRLHTELQTQQKDALTDAELRASDVEVNDDAAQTLLAAIRDRVGTISDPDTVNDLLDRILTELGDHLTDTQLRASDVGVNVSSATREKIGGLSFSVTLTPLGNHQTSWVDVSTVTWLDVATDIEAGGAVTALLEFTDATDPNTTAPAAGDVVRPLSTTLAGAALGGVDDPAFGIPCQLTWARLTVTDLVGGQDITVATIGQAVPPQNALLPVAAQIADDFRAALTKSVVVGKSAAGAWIDAPHGGLDHKTFSQANIADGSSFDSSVNGWTDTAGMSSGLIFVLSDQPLTCTLTWSANGSTGRGGLIQTTTLPETFVSGFYVYLDVLTTMVDRYCKLECANSSGTDTTIFESDFWLYDKPYPGSFGGLNESLSNLSSALLTRSVQAGEAADGAFANVGVRRASEGQFASLTRDIGLDNNRTVFGSLNVESPQPDVQVDFSEPVLNLITETTVSTGSATQVASQSVISTGTDPDGECVRRTRIPVRYRPGNELRFDFTCVFSTPVADSVQAIGACSRDDQDGVFLEYQGTTLGVNQLSDGVSNFVPQSSWNGDPLDGSVTSQFTRDGAPEVWAIRLLFLRFSLRMASM